MKCKIIHSGWYCAGCRKFRSDALRQHEALCAEGYLDMPDGSQVGQDKLQPLVAERERVTPEISTSRMFGVLLM